MSISREEFDYVCERLNKLCFVFSGMIDLYDYYDLLCKCKSKIDNRHKDQVLMKFYDELQEEFNRVEQLIFDLRKNKMALETGTTL